MGEVVIFVFLVQGERVICWESGKLLCCYATNPFYRSLILGHLVVVFI